MTKFDERSNSGHEYGKTVNDILFPHYIYATESADAMSHYSLQIPFGPDMERVFCFCLTFENTVPYCFSLAELLVYNHVPHN